MTGLELWVVFFVGLVSSLHCVQMCGPIVLAFSLAVNREKSRMNTALSGHIAYNAGRIVTYSVLGAIAGLVGHAIGFVGKLVGLMSTLALVGGSLMLVAGILMTGLLPGPKIWSSNFLQVTSRFARPISRLIGSVKLKHRFLLGLSLGFLPCGLVYSALLRALATGSLLWGACTMLAFGVGTVGALLAVGSLSSTIRGRFKRFGTQFAAVGVIAMGATLIIRGAMPGLFLGAHHANVCH